MPGGGPNFDDTPAAVEGVADEGMSAVVNRQLGLPLASQHLARRLEPLAEVAAIQRIAERIAVLRANESVIIGRPLLAAKPLPLDQIGKRAGIPGQRHLAGLVALADLAANPNGCPIPGVRANLDPL